MKNICNHTILLIFIWTGLLVSSCSAQDFETCDSMPKPMKAQILASENFYLYVPDTCIIDIVHQYRPDTLDNNIIFCAEAAFTGKIVDTFYYENIAGDWVSHGEYHHGYACEANCGGFIFCNNGRWFFDNKENYQTTLKEDSNICCAYEQAYVIENGVIHQPYLLKNSKRKTYYRALCESKDGQLMIATTKTEIPYYQFVQLLKNELQVRNALYMDMGIGWNYSWYRNEDSSITTLFPIASLTAHQTNWIIFKAK